MVGTIDDSVGRIRQTFEELGEWDNTLVILTSDNGASREGQAFGTTQYFDALRMFYDKKTTDSIDRDLAALEVDRRTDQHAALSARLGDGLQHAVSSLQGQHPRRRPQGADGDVVAGALARRGGRDAVAICARHRPLSHLLDLTGLNDLQVRHGIRGPGAVRDELRTDRLRSGSGTRTHLPVLRVVGSSRLLRSRLGDRQPACADDEIHRRRIRTLSIYLSIRPRRRILPGRSRTAFDGWRGPGNVRHGTTRYFRSMKAAASGNSSAPTMS